MASRRLGARGRGQHEKKGPPGVSMCGSDCEERGGLGIVATFCGDGGCVVGDRDKMSNSCPKKEYASSPSE